jgi:hypothetical protein
LYHVQYSDIEVDNFVVADGILDFKRGHFLSRQNSAGRDVGTTIIAKEILADIKFIGLEGIDRRRNRKPVQHKVQVTDATTGRRTNLQFWENKGFIGLAKDVPEDK